RLPRVLRGEGQDGPGLDVPHPAARHRVWTLYPMRPGELYVNFGFWGTALLPSGKGDGYYNRMVEEEVSALGGHKSLYSSAFYSEEEFRSRYNGAAYDKL